MVKFKATVAARRSAVAKAGGSTEDSVASNVVKVKGELAAPRPAEDRPDCRAGFAELQTLHLGGPERQAFSASTIVTIS
jgi:hypothetical protein